MAELKSKAIYLGFSSHDCEAWYKCPICGEAFGSWSISSSEIKADTYKCRSCHAELRGIGI